MVVVVREWRVFGEISGERLGRVPGAKNGTWVLETIRGGWKMTPVAVDGLRNVTIYGEGVFGAES